MKNASATTTTKNTVLRTFKIDRQENEDLKIAAHAHCMNVSEYLRFLIKKDRKDAGD